MNRIFLLCFVLLNSLIYSQNDIIHKDNKYYFADKIIVKFIDENKVSLNKLTQTFLNELGNIELTQTFQSKDIENFYKNELNKIYTLKFSTPFDPLYVIKKINVQKGIEWAEPYYLYESLFQPNDPKYLDGTLQHLPLIKAESAWDINQGSKDIIIAIIDTGVDWNHPDLASNIWINTKEIPNNGIDDDGNGFIDDVRGWDFGGLDGTPDNNPKEDKADHGTLVAGLAAAVTNNGIGVASIGFNSTIMAVKTSQNNIRSDIGTALIAYGYQGIIYAAENGANVINCSWGGFGYSIAAQSIIDYAISKGALVVAAAGNDNSANSFYPASYKGVLSVAATNYVDQRASFSNYGYNIDVTAPGVNIYSTWQDDPFYKSTSGTSLSSPIAAGLAALVVNQFPNYHPLQVAEQIRVNSDKIDFKNPGFENLLGYGRINAYQSLINQNSKSVRLKDFKFIEIGDGDGIFESGETVNLQIQITNYLSSISGLNIQLISSTGDINVSKSDGMINFINTLQTIQTESDFFSFKISPTAGSNLDIGLLLKFSAADYVDFEWITININPTFANQKSGNIELTLTSNGAIGFDDYPDNKKGKGLIFKDGENLLFEGAFLYGNSEQKINNVARNITAQNQDDDFVIELPFLLSIPGSLADEQGTATFNDNNAGQSSLGIQTKLTTYSFTNSPNDNFIIFNYKITNKSSVRIENLFVGQFYDFDFDDPNDDIVSYDFTENYGFVYDNSNGTYIGLTLLNSDDYGFFAMDIDGTNEGVSSYDGFSDSEKWKALSSGLNFATVGPSDISALISGGPFSIDKNEEINVAFSIAGGNTKQELVSAIKQSRLKYGEIITEIDNKSENVFKEYSLSQNYPNPFNPTTTISYTIPVVSSFSLSQDVRLTIYDILGREAATLVNQKQKPGIYEVEWNAENEPSGVYFYQLKIGDFLSTKKMILLR